MDKTAKFTTNSLLKFRMELFGLAAIWIVFYHLTAIIPIASDNPVKPVIDLFGYMGPGGVDLFLFFSAIGLSFSYPKNGLKHFYLNRFKRVFIPYLFVAIIIYGWYDFGFLKDGFGQFMLNITTLNLWIKHGTFAWYVAFIFILYAIFPLLYIGDKKTKHWLTIGLIAGFAIGEIIAYILKFTPITDFNREWTRIIVFLFGILAFGFLTKKERTIPLYLTIIATIASVGLMVGSVFIYSNELTMLRRLMLAAGWILMIVPYSFLREKKILNFIKYPLSYLGVCSLELYLFHIMIMRAVEQTGNIPVLPTWAWWIIFLFAVPPVAYLYSLLFKWIYSIKKQPKKEAASN